MAHKEVGLKGSTVAILGLGYVGLPLAVRAVDSGLSVVGIDVRTDLVNGLMDGHSHVDDVPDSKVSELVRTGFRAIVADGVIPPADVFVICVPTPLSSEGGPDLAAVEQAAALIATSLRPGNLVVLESTSYPGTTEEVVRPILETSGLRAGVDFHLAFSPERIDPGRSTHTFASVPKVVGGLTPDCRDAATAFYEQLVDNVVTTRGLREAEMAKLLENTYRHVNIALMNEMARFCDLLDIDIWDSIQAAESKPFGFQRFDPGPGVGGHCIPIDPNYLGHFIEAQTGERFRFVHLAQEINAAMPGYVVSRVAQMLERTGIAMHSARVLLLGVTYKPNVADDRETPARAIAEGLAVHGATVLVHDPLLPHWQVPGVSITNIGDLDQGLAGCDIAVLLQAHDSFDPARIAEAAPLLFDTRGVAPTGSTNVERL